jgi:membrane protease YdiL (CAAX protease family)
VREGKPRYSAEALPPSGGVTWGVIGLLVGIVAVLLALFVISFVIVLPTQVIFGEESAGAYFGQFVGTSAWHVLVVLCIYLVVRQTGGTWRSLGFLAPDGETTALTGRTLGIAFALSILARLIVVVVVFLEGLTGIEWLKPSEQIPEEALEHAWLLPFIGISVVLTAPFTEELLFRGFLYGGVRRYAAPVPAALVSGGLFSVLHFSPALFLPFLCIGAMFALTYERTHSIFVSMLVHFFFNLLSFLLLVFVV